MPVRQAAAKEVLVQIMTGWEQEAKEEDPAQITAAVAAALEVMVVMEAEGENTLANKEMVLVVLLVEEVVPQLHLPVDIPRRVAAVLVCWGKAVVALEVLLVQCLLRAEGDQVVRMGLQVLQPTIPEVQVVRMEAVAVALVLTHMRE